MSVITETSALPHGIYTLSGAWFEFGDIYGNEFNAEDVARSLACTARFTGHTQWRYSVAQHSVLVARRFSGSKLQLPALLHDASEAFIGDWSAPLKAYLLANKNGALAYLESEIWEWIARKHGFNSSVIHGIKLQDRKACATEFRDLMGSPPEAMANLPNPWPERIEPWSEEYARDEWLRVYCEYF